VKSASAPYLSRIRLLAILVFPSLEKRTLNYVIKEAITEAWRVLYV
jgi:hypothetical protein